MFHTMPRSTKIFKRRKAFGWHLDKTPPAPRPSGERESTSKVKLSSTFKEYQQFDNESFQYDIVDLDAVQKIISRIAVCKDCHGPLVLSVDKRIGLACTLTLSCTECQVKSSERNSQLAKVKLGVTNEESKVYDVNIRFVYALRSIGVGQETGQTFAGVMNLPTPSKFAKYNKILGPLTEMVCVESMKEAVETAVKQNDGDRDLACAFDGSWQRRGFSSLNGVVTATSITTGQVIDVEVMSKFCQCKGRLDKDHGPKCIANYSGTSGGMEVQGVTKMFERSEPNYGIRYKYYLGDGDCKGFETVNQLKPYGPDFEIEKMECVGHVQKRMGKRLRTYKQQNSKKILADGKTPGGKGRLTLHAIDTIQIFYGLAIRRNATKGVQAMKNAIWSEFYHLGSTDDKPMHALCPTDADTWCKYQKAMQEKVEYKHEEHTHLPPAVLQELKPIFQDLANPVLLAKCAHGGTQNMAESLNNVIWSRIPKKVFVRLSTLKLGVHDAIASYNKGNVVKCIMFRLMGLSAGKNCVAAMKMLDKRRVQRADKALEEVQKKCRQSVSLKRKLLEDEFEAEEDPDNPAYSPGHY